MPAPESATRRRRYRPGPTSAFPAVAASRDTGSAVTRIRPPSGIACPALTKRFKSTCSSCTWSISTGGSPGGRSRSRATSGRVRPKRVPVSAATFARSRGRTSYLPRRAKPSSCLANTAPRSTRPLTSRMSSWVASALPGPSSRTESQPRIPARMLLKSWATPPARVPMASRRSAWSSCARSACSLASAAFRRLMSMRASRMTGPASPSDARMAPESHTHTGSPSGLITRASKAWGSPVSRSSRRWRYQASWSAGRTKRESGAPGRSGRGTPRRVAAVRLASRMVPWASRVQ